MDSIKKDDLIRLVSKKTNFTQKDTQTFLDSLIAVFEDCAKSGTPMDIRGWGHLDFQHVKGAKHRFSLDSEMKEYPDGIRLVFSMAKNIRDLAKALPRDGEFWERLMSSK